MTDVDFSKLLPRLERVIIKAGREVAEIYKKGDFDVDYKDQRFPLTQADISSHNILVTGLSELTPELKIMSEEGSESENAEIAEESTYWCIDPIDGTNEFVNKRDQFVINVGLIGKDGPVAGMVYAPIYDDLYWGYENGAWKKSQGKTTVIKVSKNKKARNVVGSFSYIDPLTQEFINSLGDVKLSRYGSALKLTAIATGEADIYPRFAPTMEWDTAAPQAIVEAAGGVVNDLEGGRLLYRKEGLKNEGFMCHNGILEIT